MRKRSLGLEMHQIYILRAITHFFVIIEVTFQIVEVNIELYTVHYFLQDI